MSGSARKGCTWRASFLTLMLRTILCVPDIGCVGGCHQQLVDPSQRVSDIPLPVRTQADLRFSVLH